MKRFRCVCGGWLFFENSICKQCNRIVGVTGDFAHVSAFDPANQAGFFVLANSASSSNRTLFKKCDNNEKHQVCNGFYSIDINEQAPSPQYCFGCAFNRTIPDLSVPEHRPLWQKMEHAKRRTLFTICSLNLLAENYQQNPESGLSFDFTTDRKAQDHFDSPIPSQHPILTGHDSGQITINLAEADEVARAKAKYDMGERYRTLLGHFRHEIGHYYFDCLVATDQESHSRFKELFGDDSLPYQEALDRHYQSGPPSNWQENYISAYATMHPWEDWAETWAHYLHMLDTLETAQCYGVTVGGPYKQDTRISALELPQSVDYFSGTTSLNDILTAWAELSVVLNALNRSMGLADAYPFVMNDPVREKLQFVHETVQKTSSTQ